MPEETEKKEVAKIEEKKHSLADSLWWHLKSRRARLLLANLIALVFIQSGWLNLTDVQALSLGAYVTAGFIALIAAITGDKVGFLKLAETLLLAMRKAEDSEEK